MTVRIRPMTTADVERVATLCGQLGYPSPAADVAKRFETLRSRPNDAILVAEDDGIIAGWVHVHEDLTLETGPFAELGGLVVDEKVHRRGAGRLLVETAERWAVAHGYREMRVRSNVIRAGAHEFYRRLGYEVIKTQLNFRKALR